jgi:uncharacterized repeat protein (TIGR02543 family)
MKFKSVCRFITFTFCAIGLPILNCGGGDSGTNPTPPTTSTVTYSGNGNTTGTVPVDAATYASGAAVTVKGNTGNLVRTNYTFSGWNTSANGSGTTYAAGATFSMGSSNITLYALWTHVPIALNTFVFTLPDWAAPADSNTYRIYNDTIPEQSLTHRIEHFVDGGNFNYDQDSVMVAGKKVTALDSGVYQKFVRQDTAAKTYADVYVLRYFADNWAKNTFNRLSNKIDPSMKASIGTFDTSVAVGVLNGLIYSSYAHFSNYYIEYHVYKNWRDTLITNDSLVKLANSYFLKCQSIIQ